MFKRIVVPLDGSRLAESALTVAADIARRARARVDLLLVHEPGPFAEYENRAGIAVTPSIEQRYLHGLVEGLGDLAASAGIFVETGQPVAKIGEHARRHGCDLIVMTTHGRTGFSRAWIGSVADGVVRESSVPVLLLRASEAGAPRPAMPFRRILVALDGSMLAEEILEPARSVAELGDAELILTQVAQQVPIVVPDAMVPYAMPIMQVDDEATDALRQGAARYLASVAAKLSSDSAGGTLPAGRVKWKVVIDPNPAKALTEMIGEVTADAIAMTTHGRGASRLFIGSIADKVLRATPVPLLLYRPKAHQPQR
ncbi:MAG TPA: universal stress protein [Gemmatimonadaceae bacterium]|nr:universal stress protein [Gemmatimonadaceae bacterium]